MGRNGPSEACRLIGVRIAADAARRVQAEADELAIVAWNARMAEGGPAQPSPTLRVALGRGYRYLQVRCQACREATFIDLAEVRRSADTPVWKLEGALACRPCRERDHRAPRGTIERLAREPAFGAAAAPAPAEPASFPLLRLVRDERPSTRWSEAQYSVLSGGLVIGRSNDAHWVATHAPSWHWAINGVHAGPTVMQIVGNAATLDEAQQALAENWRRWLAWAALAPDGAS
jgi:hypothetical protein